MLVQVQVLSPALQSQGVVAIAAIPFFVRIIVCCLMGASMDARGATCGGLDAGVGRHDCKFASWGPRENDAVKPRQEGCDLCRTVPLRRREYKKFLKKRRMADARAATHTVERAGHCLTTRLVQCPSGV